MINDRQIIYLAGLLHDIDIFWIKGNFFETFKKHFPENIIIEGDNGLAKLINEYHSKTDCISTLLQTADIWASGFDKNRIVKNEDPIHLSKIFDSLLINGITSNNTVSYPFKALSLKVELLGDTNPSSLINLNDEFEKEFINLPKSNIDTFIFSLFYLLKKYTWCVPAYNKGGDISLFEHLKLTASIAQSLYDYYQYLPSAFDENFNLKAGKRPLNLWCIDVSGIQKFIYNISSKYASKSLKGRSFYLQAILDRLADYIIQETLTTESHIVYSSGGKFFMNLPNIESVNDTMNKIRNELQEYLWNDTFYVCFGKASWGSDSGALSELWAKSIKDAAEQKGQKFKSKLTSIDNFKQFFTGEMDEGGQKAICMVSGVEIDQQVNFKTSKESVNLSQQVFNQITLGNDLKKLSFLGKPPLANVSEIFEVKINKVLDNKEPRIIFPEVADINFLINNCASGFQFYGGTEMAILNDKVKSFEELVGIIRESRDDDNSSIKLREGNYNRLGVLRMDIDDLGKLFTDGINKDQASFSAFATLSNSLDWFFSGYLNTIRRKESYKDHVNIIYSGGDDVFIVGRWNKVILFAAEIKDDFEKFVGRKDITISAGIIIIDPKFPIAKAADMAGNALEKSKTYERNKILKNAITIFDVTIGWEEYKKVLTWKTKLADWLTKSLITTGLLQKLFRYYDTYTQNKLDENQQTPNLSWKWNLTYNLARQAKNTNNAEKRTPINDIKDVIFTEIDQDKSFRFEALIVACRWAELEVRDIK